MPDTKNFEWGVKDLIGHGSYGFVYKGNAKNKSRSIVAIKRFVGTSDDDIEREVHTLKLVQTHRNIVKFIAFEKKHLIMENCTQSLDKLLESNSNGLPSDELMVFIEHLFASLKQLRKFRVIHRDLKPGNMLVSRSKNGKNVYKLSDFGAARVLENDETYSSLYGTAEYVHPNIFAKFYGELFGITSPTNDFSCKHDIWSIAVTIIEVATGQLPFEPKMRRKNLKLQYEMMTNKKDNDIRAKEMEDGQIEWYSHLPNECDIEKTVKAAIETLLADMLKFSDEMTFEELFVEAGKLQKLNRPKARKITIRKVINGRIAKPKLQRRRCRRQHD